MIYRVVFVRFYDIKYYSSTLAIGMENCRLLGNCTTEFACFWTPPKISIALSKPDFTEYSIVACSFFAQLSMSCSSHAFTKKTIPNSQYSLKYGFCKKSLRKNATLNSWTLFSSQKGTSQSESKNQKIL